MIESSSTNGLIAALHVAVSARSGQAFSELLTEDVHWGGEQRGGINECVNRDQAVAHYEGLLSAGVWLRIVEVAGGPSKDGAETLNARIAVEAPDPGDYPPVMLARLTVQDGLISDIRILDEPARIEILYFDGCPNHEKFLLHLQDLLAEHDIRATVTLVHIADEDQARAHRFLGSPTIRIDGRDVEPGVAAKTAPSGSDKDQDMSYGMQCRLYATADGLVGVPEDRWILDALVHTPPTAGFQLR